MPRAPVSLKASVNIIFKVHKNSHDLNKRLYYCIISTSHAREPCHSRITQNSVCSRFEFGESGVLKNVFILSKHGTKANIRRTKMANNWHAYDTIGMSFKAIWRQMGYRYTVVSRLVWKHKQNQQCERLAKIRKTTGNIWSWRQAIAASGWMDAIRNQSRTQTTVAAQ
jgi:hypothetical protein